MRIVCTGFGNGSVVIALLLAFAGCGQVPEEVSVRPVLYVPENAHAAVVLRPRRMLESDLMTKTGLGWGTAAWPAKEWVQPRDAEYVLAVADLSNVESPRFGIVVRTVKPIKRDRLLAKSADINESLTRNIGDVTVQRVRRDLEFTKFQWCAFPNDQVALLSDEPTLVAEMAKADGTGTLATIMGRMTQDCDVAGAVTLEPLREVIAAEIEKLSGQREFDPTRVAREPILPPGTDPGDETFDMREKSRSLSHRPEFDFLFDIPERLRDATFTLDFSGPQFAELQIRGYDKKSARSLRQMLAQGLTLSNAAWKLATGLYGGRGRGGEMRGDAKIDGWHDDMINDDGRRRKKTREGRTTPESNWMGNMVDSATKKAAADIVDELFGSTVVTQDGATVTARWKRPVSLEALIGEGSRIED